MLISDIMARCAESIIITRPRGFGKTVNLDMLRIFFEKTEEDTSVYFRNLEIWKCGEKVTSAQGTYPVICLDFKNLTGETWDETYEGIKSVMADEFKRHEKGLRGFMDEYDVRWFEEVAYGKGDEVSYDWSLMTLTRLLNNRYHKKPIVLIDNYDTPIVTAIDKGYAKEANMFFEGFFSSALKGNRDLDFGILMGVYQFIGAGITSGYNNAVRRDVLERRLAEYFGFTDGDVKKLLADFGAADRYDEVREWYGGYFFGGVKLFNPASVMDYVREGFKAKEYWANLPVRIDFKSFVPDPTHYYLCELVELALGGETCINIKTLFTYEGFKTIYDMYSMLFNAGYFGFYAPEGDDHEEELAKIAETVDGGYYSRSASVTPVNREVAGSFADAVWNYVRTLFNIDLAAGLGETVNGGDAVLIEKKFRAYVSAVVGCYDDAEYLRQGFVLGLYSEVGSVYKIEFDSSLMMDGFGVFMEPLRDKNSLPGIMLQFKGCEKRHGLLKAAKDALAKIGQDTRGGDMIEHGVKTMLKIGVAFCGKDVEIVT
ncbi:MAG: AAA family ATPase [Clostridia bacterium]|nr:AAA family ATPase [Clostridia bacterium]